MKTLRLLVVGFFVAVHCTCTADQADFVWQLPDNNPDGITGEKYFNKKLNKIFQLLFGG